MVRDLLITTVTIAAVWAFAGAVFGLGYAHSWLREVLTNDFGVGWIESDPLAGLIIGTMAAVPMGLAILRLMRRYPGGE